MKNRPRIVNVAALAGKHPVVNVGALVMGKPARRVDVGALTRGGAKARPVPMHPGAAQKSGKRCGCSAGGDDGKDGDPPRRDAWPDAGRRKGGVPAVLLGSPRRANARKIAYGGPGNRPVQSTRDECLALEPVRRLRAPSRDSSSVSSGKWRVYGEAGRIEWMLAQTAITSFNLLSLPAGNRRTPLLLPADCDIEFTPLEYSAAERARGLLIEEGGYGDSVARLSCDELDVLASDPNAPIPGGAAGRSLNQEYLLALAGKLTMIMGDPVLTEPQRWGANSLLTTMMDYDQVDIINNLLAGSHRAITLSCTRVPDGGGAPFEDHVPVLFPGRGPFRLCVDREATTHPGPTGAAAPPVLPRMFRFSAAIAGVADVAVPGYEQRILRSSPPEPRPPVDKAGATVFVADAVIRGQAAVVRAGSRMLAMTVEEQRRVIGCWFAGVTDAQVEAIRLRVGAIGPAFAAAPFIYLMNSPVEEGLPSGRSADSVWWEGVRALREVGDVVWALTITGRMPGETGGAGYPYIALFEEWARLSPIMRAVFVIHEMFHWAYGFDHMGIETNAYRYEGLVCELAELPVRDFPLPLSLAGAYPCAR